MDETFACKPKNLLEKKRIMMDFYASLSYMFVMAYLMRFVTGAVVTEDVDVRSFPELTGICLITKEDLAISRSTLTIEPVMYPCS
jgi:hypothetical protein